MSSAVDAAENLPLYWNGTLSQRSTHTFTDDPSRLSFPATVRDSLSSNLTVRPRSIAPPVPDKPPSLYSIKDKEDYLRSPSPFASCPSTDIVDQSDNLSIERQSSSDRPSTWLNMMLTRSESGDLGDATADASASNRTPAPAIPPRPTSSGSNAASAPALPPRPLSGSSIGSTTAVSHSVSASAAASASVSTSPTASNALQTITARLQQTNQQFKIRDRLVGAMGAGRDWGGKKLQDGWKQFGPTGHTPAHRSGASSIDMSTATNAPSSLPTSVFGHKLPRVARPMAYGLTLPEVVSTTRPGVAAFSRRSSTFRKSSDTPVPDGLDVDPVTGTASKRWLPAVAYRCLQYLDVHSATEVGLYRVGGGSQLVAQIRALFDSGLDVDLRTISPQDGLDPHAVATAFKAWLRELPETSVLSPRLQSRIDALTVEALGHPASGSQMINAVAAAGVTVHTTAAGSTAALANIDRPAPSRSYIAALQQIFAQNMEAEYFHLLRALCYHLARVAEHSETNKMTLSNLRLILSPTLRLSPIFLQVIVDERETVFSGPNDSAGRREYDSVPRQIPELPKTKPIVPGNLRIPSPKPQALYAESSFETNQTPPQIEVLAPDVFPEPVSSRAPSPSPPPPVFSQVASETSSATPIADRFGASSLTSTHRLGSSSASSLLTSGSASSSSNTSPVFSSVSQFGTVATTASSSEASTSDQVVLDPTSSTMDADGISTIQKPALRSKPAFLPSRGNSLESDHAGRRSWFANRGELPAPRSPHSATGSFSPSASSSSSAATKLSPTITNTATMSTSPARPRPIIGKSSRRTGSASSFSSLLSIGSSSGSETPGTNGSATSRKALRRATSSSLLSGLFNLSASSVDEQERLQSRLDRGVNDNGDRMTVHRSSSAGRRATNRLSGFFGAASTLPPSLGRATIEEVSTLSLPPKIGAVGLGLGLGDQDEPDGSLLLSVEERRKYFEKA